MQQQKKVPQSGAHVHKLVASVATNAAYELYETIMSDNLMRHAWKEQNPGCNERELIKRFVARNWGKCIPVARATLAQLLTSPTIGDEYKERIVEALALDASLMKGRQDGAVILGTTTGE